MTVAGLFTRHRRLAHSIADGYYLPGGDRDDLRQEALIALWEAARDWKPGEAAFPSFARLVIRRRLASVLKAAMAGKHGPLNQAVRVVELEGDEVAIVDALPSPDAGPLEVVVGREEFARIVEAAGRLSDLEREALALMVTGEVPRADRRLDNAAERVKRKLREAA